MCTILMCLQEEGMETLLYGIAYLLDKGDVPNVVLGTVKLNYDPGSKSKVLRIFWSLDMAQVPVVAS